MPFVLNFVFLLLYLLSSLYLRNSSVLICILGFKLSNYTCIEEKYLFRLENNLFFQPKMLITKVTKNTSVYPREIKIITDTILKHFLHYLLLEKMKIKKICVNVNLAKF